MRRVVVTPTFAAGLGVVVAAVLAYPMQTVFSYVAPGALGQGGLRCGQDGCSHQALPTGKPEPFGAAGGALSPSSPASARPAGAGEGSPAPSGQPGGTGDTVGTGDTGAVQPQLSYKITSKWQGGFWGQITITFPGAVPASWHLRFGYPGGHILGMNPDSRLAPNGHAAVVRSSDYAAGSGPDGRTFAIGVGVQGVPTHPARCSFDGKPCHIG
jgi:Cellulose binding domain